MSLKQLQAMTPDQVVAEIRKHVRQAFGDKVENEMNAFGSRGYYYIVLPARTKITPRVLRRHQLPAFFKELAKLKE